MSRRALVDPRFGARLRELLDQRGMSYRALAARSYYGKSYLHDLAMGKKAPSVDAARRLDEVLGAGGALVALCDADTALTDDELNARELARRVAASDVSGDTLAQLDEAVDTLATLYAVTPSHELLPRVRRHLDFVARLVDARMTLQQQRRLLVAGGWLSLLAATIHIDLRQSGAGAARLVTADKLACHAEYPEVRAWCLETRAWDVLTVGDYRQAVDLSRRAQAIAPRGSSVHIQATAQEGRAWARMRQTAETRDALSRVSQLVSALRMPDQPEHHYKYDPAKAVSYTATTLAWVGDPAAVEYARGAIQELEAAQDGARRPRRVASARLDFALALVASGELDEAAVQATMAIASGRVVPSNWWRATEVLATVERADVPEGVDLREVYEAYRPASQ